MSEGEKNIEEPVLECPHCKEFIIIEKLNCGIFRHGILKIDGKQINPHAPKTECDFYINKQLIYGCGKPFKITLVDNKFVIEICDYI
jgi:hypothetical protein